MAAAGPACRERHCSNPECLGDVFLPHHAVHAITAEVLLLFLLLLGLLLKLLSCTNKLDLPQAAQDAQQRGHVFVHSLTDCHTNLPQDCTCATLGKQSSAKRSKSATFFSNSSFRLILGLPLKRTHLCLRTLFRLHYSLRPGLLLLIIGKVRPLNLPKAHGPSNVLQLAKQQVATMACFEVSCAFTQGWRTNLLFHASMLT